MTLTRVLLPGVVFQSVVVAGGYGTGRELVEFFFGLGFLGGLIGLLTTGLIWSLVCAVTFQYAVRFQLDNYRTFFQHLLGRGWVLFELSYIAVLLIVLSIVSASCGCLATDVFGVNGLWGQALMALYVCLLLYFGSRSIENMLSFWTVMLYVLFALVVTLSLLNFPIEMSTEKVGLIPLFRGMQYAGYNLGLIPAVLFTMRGLKSEREGKYAGMLCGLFAIVPAVWIFVALFAVGPEVTLAEVPILVILNQLQIPLLTLFYNVVMFMTLVETGVGLLHAFNDRISPKLAITRVVIGASILLLSALIGSFGLIPLIATGYSTLSWVIFAIYVVPILTIGVKKLATKNLNLELV